MAHLEVKPRKPYPMWVWVLLLLFVIIISAILFHIYVDGDMPSTSPAFIISKQLVF